MPSMGRIVASILLIVAGVAIVLIAIKAITIDEKLVHAPSWIIGLLGVLFIAGGLAAAFNAESGIAKWAAGTVVITITIVSGWVALYGPEAHFSGNLLFLSRETNVIIARVVFGCVSLLGVGIIAAAIKKTRRPNDASP